MFPKLLAGVAAALIAPGAAAAVPLIQSVAFTGPAAGNACDPCAADERVFTAFHLARNATFDGATFAVGGYDPAQPVEVGVFTRIGDAVGSAVFDLTLDAANAPGASASGTMLLRVAFTGRPLRAGDYFFALGAVDTLIVPAFFAAGGLTHVAGSDGDMRLDGEVAAFSLDGTIVPGIPEPRTWLMLITGYSVIGFALRHRAGRARRVVS